MFPILENLRGFFSSRPPLVVFMICLGSFAIALVTFAYFVKTKDIPNPDVKMDWNIFLDKFSKLEMCYPMNASEQQQLLLTNSTGGKLSLTDLTAADIYSTVHEMISKSINLPLSVTKRDVVAFTSSKAAHPMSSGNGAATGKKGAAAVKIQSSTPTTSSSTSSLSDRVMDDSYFNQTIAMNMDIHLKSTANAGLIAGSTQYISLIVGSQMNFQEKFKDTELVVTLTFPFNLTRSTCKEWSGKSCIKHSVTVCVNFQGPANLFPNTQSPSPSEVCVAKQAVLGDSAPVRFMASHLDDPQSPQGHWCQKGIQLRPSFVFDDSLTVLLSLEDRSIINLHLMRTSYFLFVMVVTFFCYAMIRGRPAKAKIVHIPYVEKVPTHP